MKGILLITILGFAIPTSMAQTCTDILISSQPQGKILCEGEVFSASISATSDETIHYEWYKGDSILPSLDQEILVFSSISLADSGIHKVKLFNSCDTVWSNEFVIEVNESAKITRQPLGDSVCFDFFGDEVVLETSAEVRGFEYTTRWQRLKGGVWTNLSNFQGGANDTLQITVNTSYDSQGIIGGNFLLPSYFRIQIQDQCLGGGLITNTVFSDSILLMARPYPHQSGIEVTEDFGNIFLTSVASKSSPSWQTQYEYQWYLDGTPYEQGELIFAQENGSYTLSVTNYGYCVDESGPELVGITALDEIASENALFTRTGSHQLELDTDQRWMVYSLTGTQVLSGEGKEVSLFTLPTGMYFLGTEKGESIRFIRE